MLIDGRKIAKELLQKVAEEVKALPFRPVFCDVLVGDDKVSAQYVGMKAKTAESLGISFQNSTHAKNISTADLVAEIKKLNQQKNLTGLIVQLPLPALIDKAAVLNSIRPEIDVDCTGEVNSRLFYENQGQLQFPTAAAVMALLDFTGVNFKDKSVLVIGRGELVGRPVAHLLRSRGLEVSVAGRDTPNFQALLKSADVIVSAAGRAKLITADLIKPGCVIIDAGTSESGGGVVGDVDFESVFKVAGFLSPVPGGVGPVTVAMLMRNVVLAAKSSISK